MVDAIISVVIERIGVLLEEQIQKEINLVIGVEEEVHNLSNELKSIRYVLDDAERRAYKEKSLETWLKSLEAVSYDMDDVLDEWCHALLKLPMEESKQKVCSFFPSSWCLCFKKVATRHDIAQKIRQVKDQLNLILEKKGLFNFVSTGQLTDPFDRSWRGQSTSFVDVEEIYGRNLDKEILMRKFKAEGASKEELGIHVVSIVGSGGIGKTTLAQLVYNDSGVKDSYPLRIWICVSDPFDQAEIAKGVVEQIQGICPNTNQLEFILKHLGKSVSGKKFLLVLDDVWTQDYTKWEPLRNCLKCGGAGSKILVTTRNERVAKMMGTVEADMHRLGQLSNEDCWLLLRRIALSGRSDNECEKFKDIGQKIVNKCKGLPLAAKTLGSLLSFKSTLEEWKNVLESEIWQWKEVEVDLFPHLLLSYNELSPTLKRCFTYCAFFPKDYEINVESLIRNWMALGYLGSNGSAGEMELRGRDYFDNLAMRSLFQDYKKDEFNEHVVKCKMHDIVHDFAKFLRKDTSNGGMEAGTRRIINPLLVSRVKEYRSLFGPGETSAYSFDYLTSLRVLILDGCGLFEIPKEMKNLIHLRYLDLTSNYELTGEDLKTIFELYNLKTLLLCSCQLREIPNEIGKLIQLRHLDLSNNGRLVELPNSICNLQELRSLNLCHCSNLRGLPEGIHRLINLKHLLTDMACFLTQYPPGLGQLTGLCTLYEFRGKPSFLKELNQLRGRLELVINELDGWKEVDEVKEAQLNKKEQLQKLLISFNIMSGRVWNMHAILDALEPHPNLAYLQIKDYQGYQFPRWVASPLNQVRHVKLDGFGDLSSFPPLGKLPCLEELEFENLGGLQSVGREFLGMTSTATATNGTSIVTVFPKLKNLAFEKCPDWKKWEDITAQEEDSAAVSVMPCLTQLNISYCGFLTTLPHRLLRKASSLQVLYIRHSIQLRRRYCDGKDKEEEDDDCAWKSISHIPKVIFI